MLIYGHAKRGVPETTMIEDEELPKHVGWAGLGEGSSESESGETLAIPHL